MIRKIRNIIFIIFALALFEGTFDCWAKDEGATASGNVGVLSKYIWRGYRLSDNGMVVQPSATLAYKGLSFNAWANADTDPVDSDSKWNETDFTVSYDKVIGPLTLGAGYIYYDLEDTDDTQEVYLKAGYNTLLSPTLTVYRDIGSLPGYYLSLGLSHSIDVGSEIALNLSGAAGYYISRDDSITEAGTDKKYRGFQDGLMSAALNIPITKYAAIAPTISYSFPLSDKAEDLLGTSGNVFGGIVTSFTF